MDDPVFISGLRKSGTSLVKCLLDGHPDLFVYPPNELHFFRYSSHDAAVKDKKARHDDPDALLTALSRTSFVDRLGDPDSKYSSEEVNVSAFQEATRVADPSSFADVYETLFEEMFAASSYEEGNGTGIHPVSKSVLETEFAPLLAQWFPNMKFVYVLRNPYGHFVAARNSIMEGEGEGGLQGSGLVDSLATPYPFVGSELWRMKLSYYFKRKFVALCPDTFYVLVFDDLLRNPEQELRDLANFLDIDYHESMGTPTICGVPWGGNSWKDDEFEGISTEPLYHWQDEITPLEARVVTDLFEETVDQHGFNRFDTRASLLRPYHLSERPLTYVANRVAYLWHRMGNVGSKSESINLSDVLGVT